MNKKQIKNKGQSNSHADILASASQQIQLIRFKRDGWESKLHAGEKQTRYK